MVLGRTLIGLTAALVTGASAAQALETRTYVVSWFSQGVSNADGDCAGGVNPDIQKQYELNLIALGMGISLVPVRALALYGRKRSIVRLPFDQRFSRELVLVVRGRGVPGHVAQFIENVIF